MIKNKSPYFSLSCDRLRAIVIPNIKPHDFVGATRDSPLRGLLILVSSVSIRRLIGMTIKINNEKLIISYQGFPTKENPAQYKGMG